MTDLQKFKSTYPCGNSIHAGNVIWSSATNTLHLALTFIGFPV